MRSDLVGLIQEDILSRKYVPGQRIKEEELSAQHGISRTPIREALAVLQEQGLVVQRPHLGSFVATFTTEEIVDLLRVEAVVEGLAASLSARNISAQEIDRMEELTATAKASFAATGEVEEFYNYDREFHYAVVNCSGSAMLKRIVRSQFALIYLCRYYTITAPNRIVHSIAEHEDIVNALRMRSPDSCDRAAKRHLEGVIADYIAGLRKGEDRDGWDRQN